MKIDNISVRLTSFARSVKSVLSHLPTPHRVVLGSVCLVLLVSLTLSDDSSAVPVAPGQFRSNLDLELPKAESVSLDEPSESAQEPSAIDDPSISYVVKKGDTLSTIFDFLHISQATLYQLMEADLNLLALDTIQPGHQLGFNFDEHGLKQFIFRSGLTYQVTFDRSAKGDFEFKEYIEKGGYRRQIISGTVEGDLPRSMKRAGARIAEAYQVTNLLKERMNFRSHLRAGDQFQLAVSRQYVNGEYTGNSIIEGFVYEGAVRQQSAFLFDGNYFDADGESLEKAFQRIPLAKRYRISSSFNPKRRHPVTKLIRPHNGTDFAVGIGTPVLAAGDGVVRRVIKHRYAGLYIEIQHNQKYKTRYLHLSKAYVRKGQKVSRGQKIAASGNSGRSTGAHLHYELHVNGRPVNAMTAKIPVVQTIARNKRNAFKQQVAMLTTQMSEQLMLAEKQPSE
ncbi:peptidoglycan DD-metalloendopeptidase family protein [Amphritea sp. 1_MG-2023]|uniref:peptidoglycan DD-metalloendopeptidase family protein n=1 Tax=Amphritea sp. 1_MG-2023 TaxID=3062670 RepID=UPI0026E1679E|nr:peptidoglycan DD-metalloendopeptidase family protein [Amphritea sp. 1_MG-2023]MDO6563746.1 peptidoglycan DD-metalloendopeptidase family protein [Amphritea sp. 1_MG-2023]